MDCHIYDEIHEVGSVPDRASSPEVLLEETFSWPAKWLVEILRLTYQRRQLYVHFSDRLAQRRGPRLVALVTAKMRNW